MEDRALEEHREVYNKMIDGCGKYKTTTVLNVHLQCICEIIALGMNREVDLELIISNIENTIKEGVKSIRASVDEKQDKRD